MDKRAGYVYIITNQTNTTLYTGVTSDLIKRIWQHKEKLTEGFSGKYNLNKLVYYEIFDSVEEAIRREKNIKAGFRKKKISLIQSTNFEFQDLYEKLL